MNLTPDELLNYASLHAATPLEKALTQLAQELSDEFAYMKRKPMINEWIAFRDTLPKDAKLNAS